AIITVTTTDGKKTAECKVNVKPAAVSVSGISLDKTELDLAKGQTFTLKATIMPENATDKTYTWSSSNEKVAVVKDGVVTAVAAGTATITVTATDGKKTAECKVTVKAETVYYTVTFKDGSKVLETQSVESGKAATAPEAIKKTGYTLSWDKKFDNITADTTINAVWTANKYTVKFNKNGGTVSKKSKTVKYASKYGSLPTAKRKGYTFSGWYTSKTGGKKVTSSVKVSTAKTHTLYARWTKVKVAKVSIKSIKAAKKKMTVTFKKVSGAKGYEIVYATNSKFKSAKKITTKSVKTTVTKLNSKSTIYVKVRAYKIDSTGKKVYGSYSSVKKVKIK
ncbi:MAG: InlB B-repeat-containing protein, partial [Lachnospiraceae bacterium]|nr:InlB B-repeat-containing protein [Lachnospiraceae bacterium]